MDIFKKYMFTPNLNMYVYINTELQISDGTKLRQGQIVNYDSAASAKLDVLPPNNT
jgi:hypothetical protein